MAATRERIVPRWVAPTALTLAGIGLLVSIYLTVEWASSGATLACPEGETINCAKVTSSSWSTFLGIPVAPLGLGYFAVMIALCLPARFRSVGPWPDRLRVAWAVAGTAMVLYLVWAELFQIRAICLWCTVVHVVTVALLGVVLVGQALIEPPPARTRYKDRVR